MSKLEPEEIDEFENDELLLLSDAWRAALLSQPVMDADASLSDRQWAALPPSL
jgi:hypothetical protein